MKFKLVDVDLYFTEDGPERVVNYLCAIGAYIEGDEKCEEWDEFIFFWFEDEEDLKGYKDADPTAEFTVVDYKIRNI